MKALSVKSPWAPLIAAGRKTVELRSRPTNHRGAVLIVTCLRADDAVLAAWPDVDAPRGYALCVVDIVDCRPATARDADAACCEPPPGAWTWVLANPRPVAAFPVRGQLGLYEIVMPTAA